MVGGVTGGVVGVGCELTCESDDMIEMAPMS